MQEEEEEEQSLNLSLGQPWVWSVATSFSHARILAKYMLNYHSVGGSRIDEKS